MLTRIVHFNINLCLAVALLATAGCHSTDKGKDKGKPKENKKELTFIELHLEVTSDALSDTKDVSINRRNPLTVTVDKEAFVDTAYVSDAKVLEEAPDVFSIQVKFN